METTVSKSSLHSRKTKSKLLSHLMDKWPDSYRQIRLWWSAGAASAHLISHSTSNHCVYLEWFVIVVSASGVDMRNEF